MNCVGGWCKENKVEHCWAAPSPQRSLPHISTCTRKARNIDPLENLNLNIICRDKLALNMYKNLFKPIMFINIFAVDLTFHVLVQLQTWFKSKVMDKKFSLIYIWRHYWTYYWYILVELGALSVLMKIVRTRKKRLSNLQCLPNGFSIFKSLNPQNDVCKLRKLISRLGNGLFNHEMARVQKERSNTPFTETQETWII